MIWIAMRRNLPRGGEGLWSRLFAVTMSDCIMRSTLACGRRTRNAAVDCGTETEGEGNSQGMPNHSHHQDDDMRPDALSRAWTHGDLT